MVWDPEVYLRFADLRARPAFELLARVPLDAPRLVVDLGCGPGNSTALLARRWPDARLIGVDSASAMLKRAEQEGPAAEWVLADAAGYRPPAPADLIFSNALFQWIPDHASLFPDLMERLAPGGVLAVQMPNNFGAPSHRLLAETARKGPWAGLVEDLVREQPVASPETYYDLLAPRSAALDIWNTEYLQVLTGPNAVLDWVRGTALTAYLERLKGMNTGDFLDAYAARLRRAYPPRPDGTTLFPFKRLFLVARRS